MIQQVLRFLLLPFTLLYGSIVWLRNRLYDSGFISSVSFDVPVIAVGNLSVGGTGKTPHIEYIIRLLQYEYKVATMSRGYKRRTRGFLIADDKANALSIGDEPMQYHLKFPELSVSVAEDRMTGIPSLLMKKPDTDVVLLDDAYQHRSVKPGLNILITDYAAPFYTDFILPYGRLREGRSASRRADCIVVSKCPPGLTTQQAAQINEALKPLPRQQVFFSKVSYGAAYDYHSQDTASYRGKRVVLVSGIAKPEPLIAHIRQHAAEVHLLNYPDHHFFTERNFEEIRETLRNWQNDSVIVTTEKDAARLRLHQKAVSTLPVPIIVLPIEISFLLGGKEHFDAMVREFVARQKERFLSD